MVFKNTFGLILLFGLSLFSCDQKSDDLSVKEYVHSVRCTEVKTERITPILHSFGSVSFEHKADITATVDGVIQRFYVEEGDTVREGQILALIKNVQLEIQKEKARAALITAETEYRLSESNLLDARLQMLSRFIEVEKNSLELQQQLIELEMQAKDLEDKRKLFEAGGLTLESIEKLEQDLVAAKTRYEIALKNRDALMIGLRDKDIIAHGKVVPDDKEKRNEVLIDLNTLTLQAQLDVAESKVFTAEQEVSSVNQLLNELKIRSPLTGLIGAKYLEEGERAKEADKLLTVFNSTNVYVIFPIQESDLAKISEGQKAYVTIDSLGEERREGIIHQISPTIDPQSGNLTLKVLLDNSNGKIKPGMFSRVEIVYGAPQDVVMVPDSAIARKEDDKAVVLLVNNGRIIYKTIVLGPAKEDFYHVLEGLKEGQLLIDSPSPILKEGDSVEVYY